LSEARRAVVDARAVTVFRIPVPSAHSRTQTCAALRGMPAAATPGTAGGRVPVPGAPARELGLEGVLDLLACVLEVALGLIGLALGLQVLVAGGLACLLLDLALHFLGLVLRLVLGTHRDSPHRDFRCLERAAVTDGRAVGTAASPVGVPYRILAVPNTLA